MNFYLARSFTRALNGLDKQSAALAKRAALDFQIDPTQSGFKFHRIQNARDRNMWSFRINRDLRAIVHHEGDAFILCHVDHHDEAYAWAERHKITQHPTTGQTQIVEVVERTEVITRTIYDDQTVVLPPLAEASPALLLSIGVPPEWVDWVCAASESALLEHIDRFPEDVQHNLIELLTGGLITPPRIIATPDDGALVTTSREIVAIDSRDDLERALDAPWEQWLVFLHPEQRAVAERHYSGAARIYGSAGTGKTIVALHRVKWLLEQHPEQPTLLTTYTRALTSNLTARLELLLGDDFVQEHEQLSVTNFHHWLTMWHRTTHGQVKLATERDVERFIDEACEAHPEIPFEPGFALSEFRAVIDPYFVRTRREYFDISRTGRGKPMGKRQKAMLWTIFEHVHAQLIAHGQVTLNQCSGRCVEHFDAHPTRRPFAHVVVDEAQDFSPIELQALRALAPEGPNDIFLCSDAGQRLYGRAFSWLKNGLDIRGRSTQLKINYRTTEQIRAACESLLPEALDGPGGGAEARLARSLRKGNDITLAACSSSGQQVEALQAWLHARLVDDGIPPAQIAVLARKSQLALRVLGPAARSLGVDHYLLEKSGPEHGGIAYGEMKNAKGLEYQAVAIVECDSDTVPLKAAIERAGYDQGDVFDVLEMERNLLYVAGTRARDQLFISYVGEPSQFLSLLVDPPAPTQRVPELPSVEPPAPEPAAPPMDARIPAAPVVKDAPPAPRPPEEPAPPQSSPQFRVSPSRVATYFGLNCARYLRYSSAFNPARIVADEVPEAAPARAYAQAIFESGYAWEREVLTERLTHATVHIAPGERALTERYFSFAQTLEVLRDAQPGAFIYEMTLKAPPAFYARFDMDPEHVGVSPCRPDLVEVLPAPEGSPYARVLRVIDMKRSTSVHATHHIQLAMYALLLEEVLRAAQIDDVCVDLEQGAIWLGGHDAPTLCDLTSVHAHIHDFLRDEVHTIFNAPRAQVTWHVQPKCQWCPYLTHCVTQMNATDDLSRLPRMTHQGKHHLRRHGVYTVGDVEQVLHDPARTRDIVESSATLSTQRHLMEARARALNHDEVVSQGFMARGLTIPTSTEITIVLTLQREDLGRHIYALGYDVIQADQVPDRVLRRHATDPGRVLVARDHEEAANIRRQFVVELYGLLSRVDAYNLGQQWRDRLSVQCMVYSRGEEELLTELLFEAMEERETARAARTLLMYFQGPDLILSQEHPDQNVALPVTVLLDIVGRVVALPIPVAYTLPEIITSLGADVDYPRDERFHHPFATFLRSDAIFEAWYRDQPEHIPALEAHLATYMSALGALYQRVRELATHQTHLYMPKFELPVTTGIGDPLLSRLAFFAQYEAALKCAQVRGRRMTARRAIGSHDDIHELVATSADHFTLSVPAARLEPSTFKTWLLVRDSPEGRRAQIQYNDFYYRNEFWGGGRRSPHVAVVKITQTEQDESGGTTAIHCKAARPFEGDEPQAQDKFLLYERFSNSLMDRNLKVLEALERRGADLMRRTLVNPDSLTASPIDLELDPSTLGLTTSQERALDHIMQERVLALWGPPGTGKTHFLATVILALMEAHRLVDRPFRVMIHAFTHAASENVLAKIVSRQQELGLFKGELLLGKASGWKGERRPDGVKEIKDKRTIAAWLGKHPQCVVAGTAWAYDKLLLGEFEGADLVVMDEASQIKVPEAAIGMNLVHEQGRVILAGDHLQLPPIITGTYPDPPEGGVALHRSIFEAVCQVAQGRFMKQLEENFRMNQTLTELSASLLYGERYRCGHEALAHAQLAYTPSPAHSEFARTVLAPSSSIAVVLLHGVPPGKDNALEAELVAELALALREGLDDDQGARFAQDSDFFAKGLFIVSPHHSQIQRIRRSMDELREWDSEPFVDTVDKMQGQESMAVLVSYGVSDPEFAMMEAEFIYSRNRLNVSVTRGRHKTVLLMPASLLHAPPRVLERPEAAQGLSYMRGLVEWVRASGEDASMFLRGSHQIEVLTR